MDAWKRRIQRWLGTGGRVGPRLTRHALIRLARDLESTEAVELDCGEVFRLMDQFAEAVRRGEDVADWLPLVRAHLDRCADCRQEFEALMRVLEGAAA